MDSKNFNLKIDVKKDTTQFYNEDGNKIFQEALIFRKVSKFLTGQQEDTMIPVTVFVDIKTGKICKDLLPKELWEEFGFTPTPENNKSNLHIVK